VASGIHVADAAAAARRRAEGFQMIAVSSDAGLMLAKARETVAALGLAPGTVVAKY
jgi:2-keto-3-deoxy-L-rhamnonate aldolase RhmA